MPFSSFVVPFLVQKLRGNVDTASAYGKSLDHGTAFAVNSHRLTNTLFALMTTTQAIGAFTEVVLPYLQSKISQEYHKQTEKQDKNPDSSWISQVREQCSRHPMELFSEYVEMVIQFGHVVLFSTAWPLAVGLSRNMFYRLEFKDGFHSR